ncbi:hypothetical protein BH11PLA1_BH11PLA1_10720 [soil metagenome]
MSRSSLVAVCIVAVHSIMSNAIADCPGILICGSQYHSGSCEGKVSGGTFGNNYSLHWELVNATPTDPTGGASTTAFAIRTAHDHPYCASITPGDMYKSDSHSTNMLSVGVSASANVPGTWAGSCAFENSCSILGASAVASATTYESSGDTSCNTKGLVGVLGETYKVLIVCPPDDAYCVDPLVDTSLEIGTATAQNIWSATGLVPTSTAAPAFVFCIDGDSLTESFTCIYDVNGGSHSTPSATKKVGVQAKFKVMSGTAEVGSGGGVKIFGGGTSISQGIFAGTTACPGSAVTITPSSGQLQNPAVNVSIRTVDLASAGDADDDGDIDCADVAIIKAKIGLSTSSAAYNIACDLDLDGDIDADDLNLAYALVPQCLRCQPADIAYDDGTPLYPIGPLPSSSNSLTNNGVNEADYNTFFNAFFIADPVADIANDDASPLPPFGSVGTNNGVNEGDYNLFFNVFFDGCP